MFNPYRFNFFEYFFLDEKILIIPVYLAQQGSVLICFVRVGWMVWIKSSVLFYLWSRNIFSFTYYKNVCGIYPGKNKFELVIQMTVNNKENILRVFFQQFHIQQSISFCGAAKGSVIKHYYCSIRKAGTYSDMYLLFLKLD